MQLLHKFFNSIAELVTPLGIPCKETKAEIKIHPVIAEVEIIKCLA